MSTFYPLRRQDENTRPVFVVVPNSDGLELVGQDVTYEAHGQESAAALLRSCSGASRAGAGAEWDKRLRAHDGKPILVTMSPYTALLDCVGYQGWAATKRHSRFTKIRFPMGRQGINITLYPSSPHPPRAFFDFLSWGDRYGMRVGGLGSMGSQLWRSTLIMPAPLDGFRSPDGSRDELGAEVARSAYFGARKEAPFPFRHENVTYWDMTSAYPSALGASALALSMREVKASPRHAFPADVQGVALARVSSGPPSPWSPCPARVSQHAYMFGHFTERLGAWTLRDLACARDRSDYVYIERMWLPQQESAHVFGPGWLGLVREARELPVAMRWWAKRALNATWGTFAIEPSTAETVTWEDDEGLHPTSKPAASPAETPLGDTLYVAAEITARCRQRLWDDALRGGQAIYVDTDGIILPDGVVPSREGPTLGDWTAREHMAKLEVRAPGVYRFTRADDPPSRWNYVTSGVPNNPDSQRWLFDHHSEGTIYGSQAYGGDQVILPPGDADAAIDLAAASAHTAVE